MAQARVPGKVITNPADQFGKSDQIKTHWKRFTHVVKTIPGGEGDNKTRYRWVTKPGHQPSLKEFARGAAGGIGHNAKEFASTCDSSAKRWLHNKKVNCSNPPMGLGNTKKKKTKNGSTPSPKLFWGLPERSGS